MLAKISMVIYLIAAILHFINGQMELFWLSIVLGIITFAASFFISVYRVSSQLREYEETVCQMEADGASDDEILEFMDRDTDVD